MPPGVALASAITSATVFAGTDGGDDENVRHQRDQKDRIEILAVVEGQVAIKRAVDRKRSGIVQDRVAVGRGFGDHFLADRAAGAAAIFDGELLAETLAEPGIDDARGRVRATRRRIRHHDPHRPLRPIALRARRANKRCCRQSAQQHPFR